MRRRARLALIAGLVLALGPAGRANQSDIAGLVGSYLWTSPNSRFGGFSAIEVEPDGIGFVALSDKGAVVKGRFLRAPDGSIRGIDADPLVVLRGRIDGALTPARSDSEGLAIAKDGTIYVSFEIAPRVLRYQRLNGRAVYLPIPREFSRMATNGALEALAISEDGTLYTMPEVSIRRDGNIAVFRFRDGKWDQPFNIPSIGSFLPVGADFGPDGKLYLLERQFRGLGGFAGRVRRFEVGGTSIGPGEVILEIPGGLYGNLEGLAVWRDALGSLRLTMISDDNFYPFLATRIVEFRVRD